MEMTERELSALTGIGISKITAFTKIRTLSHDSGTKRRTLAWTEQDIEDLKKFAFSEKYKIPSIFLFYIVRRYSGRKYYLKFIGRYEEKDRKTIEAFCRSQRKLNYTFQTKLKSPAYINSLKERGVSIEELKKKYAKEMYIMDYPESRATLAIVRLIIYEHDSYRVAYNIDGSLCSIEHSDLPLIYKNPWYFGEYRYTKDKWKKYIKESFFDKPPLLSVADMQTYIDTGTTYDPMNDFF